MDGYELAARFSYITNSLRFCGPVEAKEIFLDYLGKKQNKKEVETSLKKFEGLYPYLLSIAQKNKKNFYDFDVVEAYWIGNKLLESFSDSDIKDIIKLLMTRGLPKSISEPLIKKMPSGFVPHHNFNVFYVGVGNITGSVKTTIQNMDNCRTSYGKVAEVYNDTLIVSTDVLRNKGKKLFLEGATKTVAYLEEMLPDVKKGDFIGIHWGFATMVLDVRQKQNIERYTDRIIGIINKNSD